MFRLDGKVAIVTGSAGPTGRVIAQHLARAGASVVLNVHRRRERADEVRQQIEASGARAWVVEADVSRRDGAQHLVDGALATFGQVDVLVNNVGGTRGASFPDLAEEDLDFALGANLRSAFFCAQAASRPMIARRSGRIICLASRAATGSPGNANYAVAKAGVEGLTRSLALELGPYNITVNCVSPSLILSEKTARAQLAQRQQIAHSALGAVIEPIDVANAVLFFASDEARYVTGQILRVTAGYDVSVRETECVQ